MTSTSDKARIRQEIARLRGHIEATALWLCEAHPWKEWPHDDCPGPGMPTSNAPHVMERQAEEILRLRKLLAAADEIDAEHVEELAEARREERERWRGLADKLLAFDVSPTFDAKGSYSQRKSEELARLKQEAAELCGPPARAPEGEQ